MRDTALMRNLSSSPMRVNAPGPTPLGLPMMSSAPQRSASNASSESRFSMSELTTRIGTGRVVEMVRIASRPPISGMLRSIVITSGSSVFLIDTASRPLFAHPTMSISGSRFNKSRMIAAMEGESSAMSTLIIAVPAGNSESLSCQHMTETSYEAADDLQKPLLVEDGLRQVRIGAGLDAAPFVRFRLQSGHENHRQVLEAAVLFDPLRQAEAVEPRHLNVGNDDIERFFVQLDQRVLAVHRGRNVEPRGFEDIFLERPRRQRIFHHEHALLDRGRRRQGARGGDRRGLCLLRDGAQEIVRIQYQRDLAFAENRAAGKLRNAAEEFAQRFDDDLLLAEQPVDAEHDFSPGALENERRHDAVPVSRPRQAEHIREPCERQRRAVDHNRRFALDGRNIVGGEQERFLQRVGRQAENIAATKKKQRMRRAQRQRQRKQKRRSLVRLGLDGDRALELFESVEHRVEADAGLRPPSRRPRWKSRRGKSVRKPPGRSTAEYLLRIRARARSLSPRWRHGRD